MSNVRILEMKMQAIIETEEGTRRVVSSHSISITALNACKLSEGRHLVEIVRQLDRALDSEIVRMTEPAPKPEAVTETLLTDKQPTE